MSSREERTNPGGAAKRGRAKRAGPVKRAGARAGSRATAKPADAVTEGKARARRTARDRDATPPAPRHSPVRTAVSAKRANAGSSRRSRREPGSLFGRVARTAAEEADRRTPKGDLKDRDIEHIRRQMPFLRVMSRYYFRADIRGLEQIPATGPVLLIGNHSGGNVAPDIFAFVHAFIEHFGVERRFHQLAHNLVILMGVLFPFLPNVRKFGTMTASHENAELALDAGGALLVYPGGDYEVHRPTWEAAKVDFGGRKGFITLALKKNVPIVPVVAFGGQETALFLTRGERLARLFRLDKLFRLKVLPISIAPPWGLNIGDMAGHIPLPAKITIQVLPPIDLRERFGREGDPEEIYEYVMDVMQETLTDLAAERTLPVIG